MRAMAIGNTQMTAIVTTPTKLNLNTSDASKNVLRDWMTSNPTTTIPIKV
jgi:hypothetical protein